MKQVSHTSNHQNPTTKQNRQGTIPARIVLFCKKEVVLVAAAILAVLSAFVVPPSAAYIDYIDFRVLGILFVLMTLMAGLQKEGVFDRLGTELLLHTKKVWQLVCVLIFLCFFFGMFITNDVALITFVPFAMITLEKSRKRELILPVIILQTVAANLGSMVTPIGNPQNLYLYGLMGISLSSFVFMMLPYAGASFVLLLLCSLLCRGGREEILPMEAKRESLHTGRITGYLILFVLAFLVVLKVLPILPVFLLVIAVGFIMDRRIFRRVDYSLLLTFVAFFIFTGNLGEIEAVRRDLESLVQGREVLVAVLASQAVSNVPAALLLSGFTTEYEKLLIGVNLGGLGTLIASMASLISYKQFANRFNDQKGRYLGWFTVANLGFLLLLYGLSLLLG